ncbi:hypothetical protein HJC23_002553 [Cyclotella cryptica]|uniref:Reverse transcriptase Ty1/copia-type domain-containing protein n=1 Tax=Cyclotella cryptica TaxID=29204 RepID=A0ABD3QWC0_9STRA
MSLKRDAGEDGGDGLKTQRDLPTDTSINERATEGGDEDDYMRAQPTSRELFISVAGLHTKNTISDTQDVVNQLKNFFVDSSPITEFDFAKNEVIIPKNQCGIEGSKEYSSAYALATAALSPELGDAQNFVTKSEDGKADPGNAVYRSIQEQFVGNYSKIEDAQTQCIRYDFMEIVLVRKVSIHLQLPFGKSMVMRPSTCLRIGLILPCSRSSNGNLTLIVKLVMRIAGLVPGYLLSFATPAPKISGNIINDSFEALEPFEKGSATYLYLILSHMFQMTTDVVAALKSVITSFDRDGIAKVKDEAVSDVTDGLAKGSISKFTKEFKLESMTYRSGHTSTTYTGGCQSALGRILSILSEATDLYNSLSTGNIWRIPTAGGHVSACWNCNGDHGVVNASCLWIKLALRPTRRNGRKKRKRNLGPEVLPLEEITEEWERSKRLCSPAPTSPPEPSHDNNDQDIPPLSVVSDLDDDDCDQQVHGVDFFETHAPMVQWTTIWLMLMLGLKSKQGDITAAFVHADVEKGENIYVEIPQGFKKQGKVLKLKKTLYGLHQSPSAFWLYLTEKMKLCGMEQSTFYPCLFVGIKVMCICHVDDLIFWVLDESDTDKLSDRQISAGVALEQESDAAGLLGMRMEIDQATGLVELKQTGLIDRVIETLGLDIGTTSEKVTPPEAKPPGDFSYSSVVGMLLYLAGHTRHDIAYAVNCSARSMFCPRRSHQLALKRIGRYLKATRDCGLVLNPSKELKVD